MLAIYWTIILVLFFGALGFWANYLYSHRGIDRWQRLALILVILIPLIKILISYVFSLTGNYYYIFNIVQVLAAAILPAIIYFIFAEIGCFYLFQSQ
jgi:cytochrome c oxidase subunit IV